LYVICASSFAEEVGSTTERNTSPSVVIIGSRILGTANSAPTNLSVITATEIRDAGINTVNEAIRKLAGVYGRKNPSGTADFDLDLSSFGANSANNLVVLMDGVRLSENEHSVALLSSIPIDSVARIEIVPSGSSVLYGDGATGGVIHIFTKQSGPTRLTASLVGEFGQFADRLGSISVTRGWERLNLNLNFSDQHSDNYRANNAVRQQNASGTLTWYFDTGHAGLRGDHVRQHLGFPGALASATQFEQDPQQTQTPFDNGSLSMDRLSLFMEQQYGSWQLAANLSMRDRTATSNFVSMQSKATYSGRKMEFTPHIRYKSDLDGRRNELIIGFDLTKWSRDTTSNYSLDSATQKSSGIYFRDSLYSDEASVAFGVRREVFNKTSADPFPGSVTNYNAIQALNAWEVEGSYGFTRANKLFTKVGQSYRVANVDDNAFTALPNIPLLPQLSHDVEIGSQLGDAHQQFTLRFFRHRLTNEIHYDPTVNNGFGANSNLAPTQRQGVAMDIKYRLSAKFKFSAHAERVSAIFTAGENKGRELVLVPKNRISAQLNWLPGPAQKAYIVAQWVSTQRYGGDFTNTCSTLIPSHVTLDARYSRIMGDVKFAIAASNLMNKSYFTNAFGCRSSIYPDDGRQLKVSFGYGF
jgi:iron complex outermembrane receptor protein